jgi:hypothetical protein
VTGRALGLRPFFPYYGSKWTAATAYPPPMYPQIVEPFAGSAGYSLRFPDRDVLLVDINPTVAGLWRWLIAADPGEVLQLPDVPDGVSVHDLGLAGPARDLVGYWLNPGQVVPAARRSRFRSGEFTNKGWGASIRARVARQLRCIRHWRVHEGLHHEALAMVAGAATWFVDPVYQGQPGKTYRTPALDYEALGRWAQGLRGQVIVCEADGAGWLPFRPAWETYGIAGRSREAVYVRYSEVTPCPA